jgi:hypothetical protein
VPVAPGHAKVVAVSDPPPFYGGNTNLYQAGLANASNWCGA